MGKKAQKYEKMIDEFFYSQISKIFDIQKTEKKFGEKYLITGQKKIGTSSHKLNGLIERYCIDEECEIVILTTMGKLLQNLFNPPSPLTNIRLIYCFGGEASFSAVRQSGEKRNFYLKKGELLIQKSSNDISRYEVSGNNFCFLTVEFYLDCLISNLSEIMTHERINQWIEKNLDIFEPGNFYYGKLNQETEILLKEVQSIATIRNINKFLQLKTKIFQILPMILEAQTNLAEIMPFSSLEIVNNTKKLLDKYPVSEMPLVKEICKIIKVSRYQLHTSFKKIEGIGISEFIQRKKMEYGKFLLSSSDKNIIEIANEIGYENPSKFSEAFKKYFGILPNKFRKNMEL